MKERIYYAKRLLLIFFGFYALFIAVPVLAFEQVCASGYGSTAYNDTYVYVDDVNSRSRYENGTYQICFQGDHWQFNDIGDCVGGPDVAYYDDDNGSWAEPTEVPSWEVGAGSSPAGTVVDCTPVPPEATTTVATSTEAYLGSIAFGNAIEIGLLSLIAIGYVYNSLSTKKPWR